MKIILNQDVLNLGEEGDVKNVADGYARNFLLPKKFAVPYTKQNVNLLGSRKAMIEKRKSDKKQAALGLKERLSQEELVFTMPAGDSGKLFGSVGSSLILEELEKRGYSGLEKKNLEIPEGSIRMVGEYKVLVKLYGKEEAKIPVKVAKAEKEE